MKEYQLRVIEEKRDLDKKINALESFINSMDFDNCPFAEKYRLLSQSKTMKSYSTILADRISHFNNI